MRYCYLLIILAFCNAQAFAHQDTIITVDKTGNMEGLPEAYLPANIDLDKNSISIANNQFDMPRCVSKYFAHHESHKLHVTSSWYHQRSILPPYINFKISPKGKDFEYSLMFELDTLEVIQFQVITHPNEKTTSFHKIDIDTRCSSSIESSFSQTIK